MDTDRNTAPDDGAGSGAELPSAAVWAAGLFAFSSTLISLVAIWMQLKNYRKPVRPMFSAVLAEGAKTMSNPALTRA